MPARTPATILWPSRGVVENLAFESQAPFSTPAALNVRSYTARGGRRRGGSRPGFEKAKAAQLGSGAKVNLLTEVSYVDTTLKTRLIGAANGTLYREADNGSMGSVSSSLSLNTSAPLVAAEQFQKLFIADHDESGAVVSGTNGILTAGVLTRASGSFTGAAVGMVVALLGETTAQNEILTLTLNGTLTSGTFTLYLIWRRKSEDASGGYELAREALAALNYNASAAQVKAALEAAVAIGTGNVDVTGSSGGPYTIEFKGQLAGKNLADYFGDGAYLGLSEADLDPVVIPQITIDRTVIGGAGATKGIARISSTSGGLTLANWLGPNSLGGNLKFSVWRSPKYFDPVAGTLNVWETETYAEALPPAETTEPEKSQTVKVSQTLRPLTTTDTTSYRVIEHRRGGSSAQESDSITATKLKRWRRGDIPVGCRAIALWANRLAMTGSPLAPHAVFYTREGNPFDLDVSQTDAQAAFASSGPEKGQLGQPGVALMTHSQICLIVGTAGQLYVQRGNPQLGNPLKLLSPTVGIVSPRAWCHAPARDGSGQVCLFLSPDGLYAIQGECGSPPVSISRETLPERLLGVVDSTYYVSLAYCPRNRGVHVLCVPRSSGDAALYWFDWWDLAWWPEAIATGVAAVTLYQRRTSTGSESPVLWGGSDGYIRRASSAVAHDDGTAFDSYVDLGPIRLGAGPDQGGLLAELLVELGLESGPVDVELRSGWNAEAAYEATAGRTIRTSGGDRRRSYPRYGQPSHEALLLRLKGVVPETDTDVEAWDFERALVYREAGGPRR